MPAASPEQSSARRYVLLALKLSVSIVLLAILHVLNVVFVIIASIRASEGKFYRYPLTIRFLN